MYQKFPIILIFNYSNTTLIKKLEKITTELSLYKERDNEMESSDKQIIVFFMYILYRFLLHDMNIFIYDVIFRDMGDLERI